MLRILTILTAIACLALVMQGCGGCDKDDMSKCVAGNAGASNCKTFSKCLKDASCCDHEENGAKMKDLANLACTGSTGDNQCA
mmetsp:Transcript_105927/g.210576  ORF Transcript_105927/g.210576 Transcript_105927/m.210576 type:complete len:83 (+) Transcript_105927:75-323(+)